MKFSERIGIKKPKIALEKDSLTNDLRITLWNVLSDHILKKLVTSAVYTEIYSEEVAFYRKLYIDFLKIPLDILPIDSSGRLTNNKPYVDLRNWFNLEAKWYEVYECIEFCAKDYSVICDVFNFYLKRELSAYRFVGNKLVEINSEEEIKEIENALNIADIYKPVKTHINAALKLYSAKKNPDFRNSIKESISAIESLCKIITKDESATLGTALKVIEQKHKIPKSLIGAYSKLYGYSSGTSGIRHGLDTGDFEVGLDEARYMLISCSAFINYLMSKLN